LVINQWPTPLNSATLSASFADFSFSAFSAAFLAAAAFSAAFFFSASLVASEAPLFQIVASTPSYYDFHPSYWLAQLTESQDPSVKLDLSNVVKTLSL